MAHAFKFAFQSNSDANALMIGTDSPTFPPQFTDKTFEVLEKGAEAVLGASEDGGFYLIGLRRKLHERIFENVE